LVTSSGSRIYQLLTDGFLTKEEHTVGRRSASRAPSNSLSADAGRVPPAYGRAAFPGQTRPPRHQTEHPSRGDHDGREWAVDARGDRPTLATVRSMTTEPAELAPLSAALGVRPMRAGVFIPPADLGWQKMFAGALSSLTRFWGGSQNLIFPLVDDLDGHELFWALADRLDADHYLLYNGSTAELEMLAPEEYANRREQVAEHLANFDRQVVEHHLEEWRALWVVDGEIPDGLKELLVRRVAPLHGETSAGLLPFGGVHAPPYPFTDVAELADLPWPITAPRTLLGDAERLLVAAELGILPPGLRNLLVDRDLALEEALLDSPTSWRDRIFQRAHPRSTVYPWSLSELGLNWYRRRPLRRGAVAVVAGDDPWDFALFYALRRFQSFAYWIPSSLLDSDGYCGDVLMHARLQTGGATAVAVVSASDADLLERSRARLVECQQHLGHAAQSLEIRVGDWRDFLAEEPNRLFERDNYGTPQPVLAVGGKTPQLPTPLPHHVATENPTALCWMTEVAVEGWAAARNRHLGPRVLSVGAYDENLLRCGSDGAAYHCPHFSLPSAAPASKPRLSGRCWSRSISSSS
jgi:hypothetical protein